jgi:hypothetical protein
MNGVAGSVVASGLHHPAGRKWLSLSLPVTSLEAWPWKILPGWKEKVETIPAGIHNADMAATARSLLWTDGTARRHIQEQSMANRNPNDRSNQSGQSGMGNPQQSRQSGQSRRAGPTSDASLTRAIRTCASPIRVRKK